MFTSRKQNNGIDFRIKCQNPLVNLQVFEVAVSKFTCVEVHRGRLGEHNDIFTEAETLGKL